MSSSTSASSRTSVSPPPRPRRRRLAGLLRGRTWLGRELLTWLLWRSESGIPLVEVDGAGVVVLFTGRVLLRGVAGDVTEVAARGAAAPYAAQVKRALASGLLVHQARLRLTVGERAWEVTLDAEHLDVKAAKLPELLTEAEDDRVAERLDLCEQLCRFVDALVAAFLEERAGKGVGAEDGVGDAGVDGEGVVEARRRVRGALRVSRRFRRAIRASRPLRRASATRRSCRAPSRPSPAGACRGGGPNP